MKLTIILTLILPASILAGSEVKGVVMSVDSGYTFTMLGDNNNHYKVRLYGVHTPNEGQPFARESKDYLSLLINGQDVTISYENKDRYGRYISKVYCNGEYVNRDMIVTGNAWWDDAGFNGAKDLQLAQQEAAINRLGVWLDSKVPVETEKPAKTDEPKSSADVVPQDDKDNMNLVNKDGSVDVIKTFKALKAELNRTD